MRRSRLAARVVGGRKGKCHIISSTKSCYSSSSTLNVEGARKELNFYLNGKKTTVKNPEPDVTLIEYIRSTGLTGTKLTCQEGGCGACTVTVSYLEPRSNQPKHKAVNSCLMPLCGVDGMAVTTTEGLGSVKTGLHPVQKALSNCFGSQCGFCTPGFVMAINSTLQSNPNVELEDLEKCIDGNLCRCTGYRPIADAMKQLVDQHDVIKPKILSQQQSAEQIINQNPSNDLLHFQGKRSEWYTPNSLTSLLKLKLQYPKSKLVVGNTEIGIEQKILHREYPVLICPTKIPELRTFKVTQDSLVVGSIYPLSDLFENLKRIAREGEDKAPEFLFQRNLSIKALIEQLNWFSGTSIRNTACLGGNIATGSPISDVNPVLVALDAKIYIAKDDGKGGIHERVAHASQFFGPKYRQVDLHDTEVITRIEIPLNTSNQYVRAFKHSKRREDDIAIVNSAMSVTFKQEEKAERMKIEDIRLAFGGMGPCTVQAKKTEQFLNGKEWNYENIQKAVSLIVDELKLEPDSPGGMESFRTTMSASFLYSFFLSVSKHIIESGRSVPGFTSDQLKRESLGGEPLPFHIPMKSTQSFPIHNELYSKQNPNFNSEQKQNQNQNQNQQQDNKESDKPEMIGSWIPAVHSSAERQVSGEAIYTDDIPRFHNELVAAIIPSVIPKGELIAIDWDGIAADEALKNRFEHILTVKDIPGDNLIGDIVHDEEVFVSKKITAVGQAIGCVLGTDYTDVRWAARRISEKYVKYNDDTANAIFSITEAIQKDSFFPGAHTIDTSKVQNLKGTGKDVERVFSSTPKERIVTGELKIGGQEHFYFEPQVSLVEPRDGGEIIIHTSTQNLMKTQKLTASVLAVPNNKVVAKVRRIGGGFGGKETQNIVYACIAAVGASKYNRPVRLVLTRDEDMMFTGKRHPFMARYKVAFEPNGKITAAEVSIFNNGGFSHDLSWPVMDRSLFHLDNSYKFDAMRVSGRVCKTNVASNTAFRGFGGPQGMMVCETWIEHVAHVLGKDPCEIREINFYPSPDPNLKETEVRKDLTHFGQAVDLPIREMWQEFMADSQYKERKQQIEQYNKENKWRKKGIAAVPVKFGLSFTATLLNQGSSLVHIYTDGSVLISHGGVEMGQGLHTKVIQVASQTLGVPLSHIYVSETATDKIANSSATAASMGSDIYGMATLNACNELKSRLEPYLAKNNNDFKKAVTSAYVDRVNLSAQGFHKVPVTGYDFVNGIGKPFHYFTNGFSCTEVLLDTLTSNFIPLRTDITLDLGQSINPAIDIGQIEGAYLQGLGWLTTEELVYGDREHKWVRPGWNKTNGPGNYKIPTMDDVPREWNVKIRRGKWNEGVVMGSKGVGEPPLFLGASTIFAIRSAVMEARKEEGREEKWLEVDAPWTKERIRMACGDGIVREVLKKGGEDEEGQWKARGSF
eukprot:TRINITY_DN4462_c0_g1_i2.p1 TRINITY_DN4462_c0_g1~~TRINITY_DN4462_c0_g1_i2.p1  ORF type:complete len:1424 (+),score=366.72 TRINITY_DN4462_c0_g1_i2:55-4326(+)